MTIKEQTRSRSRLLVFAWTTVLLLIPLLSYAGRKLQHFLLEHMSRLQLGIVLLSLTLLLISAASLWLVRRWGARALVHLLWAAALACVIFYLVPPGERWFHVPLFGTFGFLSVQLFGFRWGILVALLMSAVDETWQLFLPDRNGDPLDAMVNAVSATLGGLLSRLGKIRRARSPCQQRSNY